MGMTLWIHTLEGRDYSKESDDHSLMHRLSDELDALCTSANIRQLTDYFDYTDLEYSYGGDDLENDGDTETLLDPETGLAYGIDDMRWFDAADGLATLAILRDRVNAGALANLTKDETEYLLEELTNCISILQGPASRSGKFHLSVVE